MQRLHWNRKALLCVLTISLAFNAGFGTTFAVRTYGRRSAPHRKGHRFKDFYQSLNLTAEQRAAIQANREKLFAEMHKLRRSAIKDQARLADLVTAADPDREAIAQQLAQVANAQRRIQERLVEHLLERKALLPPESHERFNALIRHLLLKSDHRGGAKHRHGGKGGRDRRRTNAP